MKNFIKSPINYTGNKYRLLEQFKKYIPETNDVFVDLFCGGATVGFNINANVIMLFEDIIIRGELNYKKVKSNIL